MARNILASPRAPSCVLNHFPVDSAVCNPIIGVSPPGKLLFYSRTTRAPGVYRDIPCLPSPRPVLVSPPPTLFYSLPSSPFDRRRLRCSSKSIFFFFSSPSPFLFLSSFTSLVSFLSGGGENPGREVQSSLALVKGIVNIYPVIVTGGRHKRGGMSLRGEEIWFSSSEIDKGI